MTPHFKQAARELADFEEKPSLATLAPAKASFEAWYYGKRQPQRDARRVLVRPSQSRDLHFMATLLSFFMAKGSHDMGDARVAMVQARAAGFCAEQAEHKALIALVDGLKSLISYWANKPEDALHYARHGLRSTRTGERRSCVSKSFRTTSTHSAAD